MSEWEGSGRGAEGQLANHHQGRQSVHAHCAAYAQHELSLRASINVRDVRAPISGHQPVELKRTEGRASLFMLGTRLDLSWYLRVGTP